MESNSFLKHQLPTQRKFTNLTIENRKFTRHMKSFALIKVLIFILCNIVLATNPDKVKTQRLTHSVYSNIVKDPNLIKIFNFMQKSVGDFPTSLDTEDKTPIDNAERISQILLSNKDELDLSNLDIDDVPTYIYGALYSLKKLCISNNPRINLTSSYWQVHLKCLVDMDISYCDLNTEDFICLKECKSLEVLNISGNPKIDLSDINLNEILPNIKKLYISRKNLNEKELENILRLTNLQLLDISENHLSGAFKTFGNLAETLEVFNLSDTGLTYKDMQKIDLFTKLKDLDVSKNNLNDSCYGYQDCSLQNILRRRLINFYLKVASSVNDTVSWSNRHLLNHLTSKLTNLNVSQTNISQASLEEIFSCTKLKKLVCTDNSFSFFDWKNLKPLALNSIEEIDFSNCDLEAYKSDKVINEIFNCGELVKLNLSKNKLKTFDFDLENCNSRLSLKHLILKGNSLNIKEPLMKLSNFQYIEHLDLSDNFKESDIEYFKDHATNFTFEFRKKLAETSLQKSLKKLFLKNCKFPIDCKFLDFLAQCRSLVELDLSCNSFMDTDNVLYLRALKNSLKRLSLSNCSLIGKRLVSKILELPNLEYLDLSGNQFLTFPSNFESFTSFKKSIKELIISDCRIDVVDCLSLISQCTQLKHLDFSGCLISKTKAIYDFGEAASTLQKLRLNYLKIKNIENDAFDHELDKIFSVIFKQCINLQELGVLIQEKYCDIFTFDFVYVYPLQKRLKKLEITVGKKNIVNIKKFIRNCKGLVELNLNCIKLQNNSNHFEIGDLKYSLRKLKLEGDIKCLLSLIEFIKCENLEEFNLSCLSKDWMKFCRFKNSLKKLVIADFDLISAESFKELTDFPKLKHIEISTSKNDDRGFSDFKLGRSKLTLETLIFTSFYHETSYVAKEFLLELTSCPRLKNLSIENCNFKSSHFIFGISSFTLQKLKIKGRFKKAASYSSLIKSIRKCIYLYKDPESYCVQIKCHY